ncbi:hypothetical protein J4438_02230 [Candidatus Woesearchaeota archaeon]|nr:hypothetical protein [Candidatus Woesearchaeota archaeon]
MFFKTKKTTFKEINDFINSELERKKFTSALAAYHQLREVYNSSNEQEKYYNELNEITRKLIILTKVQELHNLIHTNDLESIGRILSEIREWLKENNGRNFYSYIDHHHDRCLKIYLYKQKKEELKFQIDNIHKLMEEENYDIALMQFPELMRVYNEMSTYHRNEEIIKELEQLKSQIKMSLLKQRAYGEVAELNIKRVRKLLEDEDIDSSRKRFSDIFERI